MRELMERVGRQLASKKSSAIVVIQNQKANKKENKTFIKCSFSPNIRKKTHFIAKEELHEASSISFPGIKLSGSIIKGKFFLIKITNLL